jgi:DNA-binding transcriptional LysR family regulator
MKLQQLRYFVVLADELHFRRAAERLNITQAPLSLAIQELERELGGRLFNRTRRQVSLTEIGRAMRENGRLVLEAVDRSVQEIRRILVGTSGEIRIGFTAASSLLSFFPAIIHAFRTKYPDVHVSLTDMPSNAQITALQSRQLDAGIIRTPPVFKCPADITSIRLLMDPLVVAVNAFHPLHSRRQLKLADLKDERFIFYPRSYGIGIYDQFIKLCAARSFVPTIVQEAKEASTIIGLVATGLGIAVVPSSLRYIGIPNIAYIPLSDADATTQLLLVYRAGEANTRVANLSQMARAKTGSSRSANETKLRPVRRPGRDEKSPSRKRKPPKTSD